MKNQKIMALCESAVLVAMSVALGFANLSFAWMQGGSVDLAVVPLIILAYRRGFGWGIGGGMAAGLLHCIVGGGIGWGLPSILLDYVLAYGCLGFAAAFRKKKYGIIFGTLIGCFLRFAVHFISGVTIYKIMVPTEIIGMETSNAVLYSIIYNGSFMLINTIAALVVLSLLRKVIQSKFPPQFSK